MRSFTLSHHSARVTGTALLAAALLIAVASPAYAAPPPLQCGSTITQSVTLQHDILNCSGAGLIVGADRVILNLNGHTLSSAPASQSNGIEANTHSGVLIKNGTILGFDTAISFDTVSTSAVSGMRLADQITFGVLLVSVSHTAIFTSSIYHTGDAAGNSGILAYQSDYNVIFQNRLDRNGDGVQLIQSSHNLIDSNTSGRSGAGISMFDASNANLLTRNATNDNSDSGILLDQGANNNVIARNSSSGNAFGGIVVGASNVNRIVFNRANNNLGAGIAVVDNANGTVVEGNVANFNGANPPGCTPDCPLLNDGIDVTAPATTISANRADHNADLGIDAVAGVTDGGRNEAHANVNPAECSHVVCVARP